MDALNIANDSSELRSELSLHSRTFQSQQLSNRGFAILCVIFLLLAGAAAVSATERFWSGGGHCRRSRQEQEDDAKNREAAIG